MAMELAMAFYSTSPMPRATTRCGTTRNCLATFSGQAWIVNDIGLGAVAMLYT